MANPETLLQAEIMAALGVLPGVVVWRNNIGTAQQGERRVAYGVGGPGAPDLLCEVRTPAGWAALWLEVKTATGTLRPDQRRWHEAARADGRHVYTVRSVADALAAIDGVRYGA